MKKLYLNTLLATSLALALLAGCGGTAQPSATPGESEQPKDLLAQIQERGEIIVAMEGTWAPWTYHDESDTLVGFDTEVAQKVAEKLGVTATFAEGGWDGLLAGLDGGRYDIMVNGVSATEERAEKYDFSIPYAYNRMAVIVRGDDDRIQTMEDLEGMTTANTITSIYAAEAEAYGATVTGVDDLSQTLELLTAERIDATLNDEVVFYDYMRSHPEANLKIACLGETPVDIVIPMRKGDETASLRAAIDQALEELREEGSLSELSNKYFYSDITTP